MLLYTEFQRERAASPKVGVPRTREARRRATRSKEPYYLPGSIETFLGGEMNMSQYTEGERNIRHYLKYGTYPAPPRRYQKQQYLGQTTPKTSWAVMGGLLLAGLILCKIF